MTLEAHVRRWRLVPDGEPFRSVSSELLPVRFGGEQAILKVPHEEEERFGGLLMRWWDGEGAARVLAFDEASGALVLERASGPGDLAVMVAERCDDEATRILCAATARLHAPRGKPPPDLIPLRRWFETLPRMAARDGERFGRAAEIADMLLLSERDVVPLHGDIHHGNVLDFGDRGWLAVDPKRLVGERTFDYVNMLRNPDPRAAPSRERFGRQADLIAETAGLDRRRLMLWTLAFAGLSAAWCAEDEKDAEEQRADLAIMALARAELDA